MIKLAISGCCGKMGQRIIALAAAEKDLQVAAAIESSSHPAIGKKLAQVTETAGVDIQIKDQPQTIQQADVLIEFTNPQATIEHLNYAIKYKKTMVIGTTGLAAGQTAQIKKASQKIPILFSPNMSPGVNLTFKLVEQAAQKLDSSYKADVLEAHHVHKKDKPSGTAKRLAELIEQIPGRQGAKVEITSVREGEIVGVHQVRFQGPQDTIVIKHSANSRDIFAQGALQAARFIVKQKPGLYDMQDVIR